MHEGWKESRTESGTGEREERATDGPFLSQTRSLEATGPIMFIDRQPCVDANDIVVCRKAQTPPLATPASFGMVPEIPGLVRLGRALSGSSKPRGSKKLGSAGNCFIVGTACVGAGPAEPLVIQPKRCSTAVEGSSQLSASGTCEGWIGLSGLELDLEKVTERSRAGPGLACAVTS